MFMLLTLNLATFIAIGKLAVYASQIIDTRFVVGIRRIGKLETRFSFDISQSKTCFIKGPGKFLMKQDKFVHIFEIPDTSKLENV